MLEFNHTQRILGFWNFHFRSRGGNDQYVNIIIIIIVIIISLTCARAFQPYPLALHVYIPVQVLGEPLHDEDMRIQTPPRGLGPWTVE